ncbi:hypothetical protein [Roseateles violae]|uniref:L,D-transpeptidase n=1 Tax=Roseateles violae TaxID=3058042 RepID=A0ABT8DZD3_9BURK|nr:hypothetical protein [Pelomonas sp. PFR6]MDN3922961.1 hypothetical protein [Pelomonas sp. PFR6]
MDLAIAARRWLDADVLDGMKRGLLLGTALLVLLVPPLRPPRPAPHAPALARHAPSPPALLQPAAPTRRLEMNGERASQPVLRVARWVVESGDNGSRFFAILDKKNARVFVFEPGGRLRGQTPVLLGFAAGDDSVEGIGDRPIAEVKPQERTTPAGRFVAEPGRNANNEEVIWVDYDAAVSMHRVRLNNPKERRAERLASPTAADNRISYGCINMPPAFFEKVLWPNFRERGGIVYVLPEVKPLTRVFPALAKAA